MNPLPPQHHVANSWPACFIKFRVNDQARFQILAQIFEISKQEKSRYLAALFEDEEDQENDYQEQALRKLVESLFDLFDEQALAHFWWPSKQEQLDYVQRWQATPVPQRFTDPSLKTPWDFESMIDSLLNGEYELLSCRILTPDTSLHSEQYATGVFEFLPFSFPYGGTGCMKALIEAFGFQILGEDDGTGYISALEPGST